MWFQGGKRKAIVLVFGGVVLLAAGVSLYVRQVTLAHPLPESITGKVDFPIYYPRQLPGGYKLDKSTTSSTNTALLFSFINPDLGTRILVSEQPAPPKNLDLNSFYSDEFTASQPITTPVGDGVFGNDGSSAVASITSRRAWILIKGPVTSGDQIRFVATKLAAAK